MSSNLRACLSALHPLQSPEQLDLIACASSDIALSSESKSSRTKLCLASAFALCSPSACGCLQVLSAAHGDSHRDQDKCLLKCGSQTRAEQLSGGPVMAHPPTRNTRARPLDPSKHLELITDITVLDAAEGYAGSDLLVKLEADEREAKAVRLAVACNAWARCMHAGHALELRSAAVWLTAAVAAQHARSLCTDLFMRVAQAKMQHNKRAIEIPIPPVCEVTSYGRDYLPSFRQPTTYMRGRGAQHALLLQALCWGVVTAYCSACVKQIAASRAATSHAVDASRDALAGAAGAKGYWDDHVIEYDLSLEDRAWLADFNQGQNRLPPRRLELLFWQLEICNSAATDHALASAGESALWHCSALCFFQAACGAAAAVGEC